MSRRWHVMAYVAALFMCVLFGSEAVSLSSVPHHSQSIILNSRVHSTQWSGTNATAVYTVWGFWDKKPMPYDARENLCHQAEALQINKVAIWNRLQVQNFFHSHDGWDEVWPKIKRAVAQSDLARYFVAYEFGGVYMDTDVDIYQQLPKKDWQVLLQVESELMTAKQLGHREKPYLIRIANFFFVAKPKHKFFKMVLNESLNRCKKLFVEGNNWTDSDILWATGPDVVTTIYHEHFKADATVLILKERLAYNTADGGWRNGNDTKLSLVEHQNNVTCKIEE